MFRSSFRVLLATGMIFSASLAQALPDPSSGTGVAIAYLGESNGDGTYRTKALSIAVGNGEEGFTVGAWANANSVATAVGSAGTIIQGPDEEETSGFESSVCVPVDACTALFPSLPE